MDNLVEVATFTYPNDTDVLESILQREGIIYFLKDENSSTVIPGIASAGGIKLTVRVEDVDRTIKLIEESGFNKFLNS